MPDRVGEVVGEVGLADRDGMELGAGARRHLARDRALVVVGAVEGQREGADRIAAVARREAQHGAGVDAAAQVAADRHVGAQPQAHRLVERVPERLGVLGVGTRRPRCVGRADSRSPSSGTSCTSPARGEQVVAGRHLVDAVEERAVLLRHAAGVAHW